MRFSFLPLLICLVLQPSFAQQDSTKGAKEKDVIDVVEKVLNKSLIKRDTITKKSGRIYFSGSPSIGYSLSSGWAGIVVANGAFYTSEEKNEKLSNVYTDGLYTQNRQLVFHLQSNLWTKGNKFNIVNDWRYYDYPQKTYGLGGSNNANNYANQTFKYLRLYQTLLKSIRPNLYAGFGYAFDYHWKITGTSPNSADGDAGVISGINAYGISDQSTSSGLLANILFDNRINSINPAGGSYANIVYRQNYSALGSDNNYQTLLLDLRQYVPFPRHSENILAFWSYNWLTLAGNPPYLDLPSTGWDTYSNTGRGYIQGRFRSKNMIYLEAEYRFKISPSGLFGGVVFVNGQSFSEWPSNTFRTIAPAAGLGLRLKFNKYSRTNIAIDYGFGQNGSQGIFVNLGEVF
ncbi:MAG TPA: BamA/TamA family outer membrane protein [Cyclobacteriaceae bacterium]|nr:BamA/TamA family outer membrane protein [Cyclobacteriaceae bacterium]